MKDKRTKKKVLYLNESEYQELLQLESKLRLQDLHFSDWVRMMIKKELTHE